MANDFVVTNAVAQSMLTALGTALDAGTAAVVNIYSGTVPADADAALSGNTLLAQLTCSGTAFSGISDTNPGARATFAAITPDSSADATGVATFFRILTQNAGTVCCQGTVGTTASDLVLNTTSITAGSQVSITSATIDHPER